VAAREIRELRDELGLTQAAFGQLLGAHAMTVSKWEREGGLTPSPYQIALMRQFQLAAGDPAVRGQVGTVLIGAGVAAAIYLLLRAAFGSKRAAARRRP